MKGVLYIPDAFGIGELGLLGRVANTQEGGGIDGQMEHLRQATADIFALVVAALAQAVRMDRNRHEQIDALEESTIQPLRSCLPAEQHIDLGLLEKLAGMDDLGDMIIVMQPRSATHESLLVPLLARTVDVVEEHLDLVLAKDMVLGAG